MDGKRLGDDLTDNAYEEDGYRFHDVMHLALAAKLGWSPVLRRLMGRKRRWDSRVDEVEDGARAAIVEEAVIKAIHSEGERMAALGNAPAGTGLFRNGADISFNFLKRIASLVAGLEVQHSRYWEWEIAIVEGFALFRELREHRRGTVEIDLEARTLAFTKDAYVDVVGGVAGTGTAFVGRDELPAGGKDDGIDNAETLCRRRSVAAALSSTVDPMRDVAILGWRGDLVDVQLRGAAQDEAWRRGIVAFRVYTVETPDGLLGSTIAIFDTRHS